MWDILRLGALTVTPGETILELLRSKEFIVSSSPKVPVNPRPEPPAQRERAKHYQLEAIAYMAVSGTSPSKMAAVTDLSESYIIRLLSGKGNKTFNRLRGEYKRENLKNAVGSV